ncbi:MAG TPA: bifunctional demethylmenaquinone methyltransferase/2-methoxy-6-polyprenyl-1,4-benzoquinol methylase UbiE [Gammaproteobacteria bacterium]|nr:bifunctional demethylmenaquinone methyltransferase/2-methoxy-6-polyprenyl-1,4-benzoquinol methylase UbiE [Gammaproteobacteria bacterium]HQY22228.1 bifunctional demethylmenaquinone methyltransferase/2-methoxy-6-polyprenyl-1,4-benzoquinol methylase UbiE [Gammaproteobacteria bacterium]HQZ87239.1 bifunctional demethylmenaquinone methyltransferase/2-methoxy-6-polyprenyl-1,4-benzoquinol methylase UbiE [Gammaproteobacteria bacterium]HRA42654.1 bifunctional demethylmenaquinone methyltransferase/2-met
MAEETTHFGYQSIATDQKTERVGSVFRSVANRYDLMNDLMSFGLHRFWKRLAIARSNIRPHHTVLDLAGGTGDLTRQVAKLLGKEGLIVLADINEAMLTKGRERLINAGFIQPIALTQANAESIPFANNSFDRIICAFGLRNVTHPNKALAEMSRVLKPGGQVMILEFSTVNDKMLGTLYNAYSFSILPKLGEWICNDRNSYQYLAESIRVHPNQETLKSMMCEAGFERTEYQNLHAGIVALHTGYKF